MGFLKLASYLSRNTCHNSFWLLLSLYVIQDSLSDTGIVALWWPYLMLPVLPVVLYHFDRLVKLL